MCFPHVIAQIICEYSSSWQLLPWIKELIDSRKEYLVTIIDFLWANPRGLDECFDRNLPMNWEKLCLNPHPWAVYQVMNYALCHSLCFDNMIRNPGLDYWIDLSLSCRAIVQNPSNRTTEYVVARLEADPSILDKYITTLCLNSNDLAVTFILDRIPVDAILETAWSNSNPRMFKTLWHNCSKHISWI